ncbi:MAG: family 43 glycosylhydrolase [Bacteroidaceae bacterium]|nr:family 43 glycosylhydrolase [Bacteroidaceae bacterium]
MKKTFLTITLAALSLAAFSQKSATISMSRSTKYQYIDGFGGTGMNGQWGDVYTQEKVNKLWGKGEGQMGLNIMRIRINPNENNWGEYGNAVKWARRINPDVQVFATPWTPPKMYKTSKSSKYQNEFGTWVWPLVEHSWGGQGSNGGTINDASIPEFADFLERYRATMEAKGCPIDIISIQNECDYTPTATDDGVEHASYESCIYSPKQMAATVKAARAAVDPKCKIMGPETFGWGQANYNNTLLGMKDAVDNIDIWGNHLYGSNDLSFINNVTSKTGKHMWMTEFLIDYPSGYSGKFSAEYDMIKSLESAMQNGYNGYVYYNMLNDFFACNHGGSDTQLWKRAYVFSHYAKYATGKTRIKSTFAGSNASSLVGGSAYVSEGGDTISLFVLNPTEETFTLNIGIPINPNKITAIVTGDAVNTKKIDITEQYTDGTKRMKTTLMPGMFYTFLFEKVAGQDSVPTELATAPKLETYGNPINPYNFCADPTAIEYNGRLYVYGTNDQQEFDASNGLLANSYGKINQLVCFSTADMVNWTNHGTIDVKAIAPWVYASWAPSIISRVEEDGLTHFYLYFTNSATGIGVLTSTSPTGPWTDPLGHALIDSKTAGLGSISQIIDPGAAIKPDGTEAYLTFGGGDIKGTALQPGNARIVKLGSDLISLDGDIQKISAPCHFEANELNYIGSKWVYSYCTRWTIASDWSSYSKANAPTPCSIVYLTASDPMADSWSYKGEVVPNPGRLGYPAGNNHTHLQKFGSVYYMFYHTQWLESQLGYSGGYRSIQMNKLTVAENVTKLAVMNEKTASLDGVSQLTSARVNPFEKQSAAMLANAAGVKAEKTDSVGLARLTAISAGDWTMVRGVQFTNAENKNGAKSLYATLQGTGTMEVRLGSLDAEPVATINFECENDTTIQVNLENVVNTLQSYVYFVFPKAKAVKFTDWQFSPNEVVEPKPDPNPDDENPYDLDEDGKLTVDDITALIELYLNLDK